MYFLPEEIISRFPTLCSLPRCAGDIFSSGELMAVVQSDAFFSEIADAAEALIFPHLGFRGRKEHYTGYTPLWKFCAALPIWNKHLAKDIGFGLPTLMRLPRYHVIPFFDFDFIDSATKRMVECALAEEPGWQASLDVMREIPCEEDFEPWNTNVRKDFLRKWYHTRSKRVKMISLDACLEDDGHGIHEIADASVDFEERIVAEDYVQRFKARLSEKDMRILELRVEGHTYEDIASRLGYKNHSGVLKRIRAIAKAFLDYEDIQGQGR